MSAPTLEEAISFIEQKDFNQAEAILVQLRNLDPANARINYTLAIVAIQKNDLIAALALLDTASRVATEQPFVFSTFSSVLLRLGDATAAYKMATRATALAPKSPQGHIALGEVFAEQGKADLAIQSYETALTYAPDNISLLAILSRHHRSLGHVAKADELLNKALQKDPQNPEALVEAARTEGRADAEDIAGRINSLLAERNASLEPEHWYNLSRAAAAIAERIGDWATSFSHHANDRSALHRPYNKGLRDWQVKTCKDVFTPEYFAERRDVALTTDRPIFVLGMPESGCKEIEALLARHPNVRTGGEIGYFSALGMRLAEGEDVSPAYFRHALHLEEKDLKKIGSGYLKALEAVDKKARRIVDTNLFNYQHLWLLALLFPNASFVHAFRSPLDACAAIYTSELGHGHNYMIDQESIGHHYKTYGDLVDHWSQVLPIQMHHVSYEALINNRKEELEKLLTHVGLPHDTAYVEREAAETSIPANVSASARIGFGADNAEHLGPLTEALGPLAKVRLS